MNYDDRPTCPCGLCGKPTPMLGTQRCDACWELESRVRANPGLACIVLAEHELSNSAEYLTRRWLRTKPSAAELQNFFSMMAAECRVQGLPAGDYNPGLLSEALEGIADGLNCVAQAGAATAPAEDTPRWGHPDPSKDTDPSRQQQPIKRASAMSTASASASTLSTWD